MECEHKLKIYAPYGLTIDKYYIEELNNSRLRSRLVNNKFYIHYECEECGKKFMKIHSPKEAREIFNL